MSGFGDSKSRATTKLPTGDKIPGGGGGENGDEEVEAFSFETERLLKERKLKRMALLEVGLSTL